MNNMKTLSRFIIAAPFAALLAACGGGENGEANGPARHLERVEPPIDLADAAEDPRIVKLQSIVEDADTLLSAALHYEGSVSAGPISQDLEGTENFTCAGLMCTGDEGTEVATDDELLETILADPREDLIEGATMRLGTRGGFDTVQVSADIAEVVGDILDGEGISLPMMHAFGYWGEYGAAVVAIMDGALAGRIEGTRVDGDLSMTMQFVAGQATGSSPRGLGSATWTGIAEAVDLTTFERRKGTATLRIADLASPAVSAEVNIAGRSIGSDAWNDMALAQGRFTGGNRNRDYLEGLFFGPDHAEAFGVFDTSAYAGTFGAKREPRRRATSR